MSEPASGHWVLWNHLFSRFLCPMDKQLDENGYRISYIVGNAVPFASLEDALWRAAETNAQPTSPSAFGGGSALGNHFLAAQHARFDPDRGWFMGPLFYTSYELVLPEWHAAATRTTLTPAEARDLWKPPATPPDPTALSIHQAAHARSIVYRDGSIWPWLFLEDPSLRQLIEDFDAP